MICRYLRCRERARSELHRLFEKPERGQGLVEYALIAALISVVVIVVLALAGHRVNNVFSNLSSDLTKITKGKKLK